MRKLVGILIIFISATLPLWALNGNVWVLQAGTATRQVDGYWQAWPTVMKLGSGKLLQFYHEASSGQNVASGTNMLKTSTATRVLANPSDWDVWTGNVIATVTPTAIGSGYSSTPSCAINGNGAGSGATCTATAPVNGAIPSITLTSGGSGYLAASNVSCTISGGGGSGATCKLQGNLVTGVLSNIYLTAYGIGYTSTPTCTISGGGGSSATCTVGAPVNGAITSYTFSGGSGYVQKPEVVIYGDDGGQPRYAIVSVTVSGGAISALNLLAGGVGYAGTPHCKIEATTGSGATCTATFSSGAVNSVTLGAAGSGYQQGPTVSVTGGGGSGATAVATLNYCAPNDRVGCLFSDNTGDYRNIGGGITPAGTIVACSELYDFNSISNFAVDDGVWIFRSTDNGNSWQSPFLLSAAGETLSYSSCLSGFLSIPSSSPGVTGSCASGCIAMVTRNDHFGQTDGYDIALVFSYDDGLTWGDRRNIKFQNAGHTDETAVAWLGGNNLILFNRGAIGSPGSLQFGSSTDMGVTWTLTTTNFPMEPTPSGESCPCQEEQVDPSLFTPSLPTSNLQTLFFGARFFDSAGGRPIIRSITFDQNAAVSSPTGFAAPPDLYNGGNPIGPNPNFSCYSTAVQISSNMVFVAFMQPYAGGVQSNLYYLDATFVQGTSAPAPQMFAMTTKGTAVQ